ncbi:MAG: trehalose-phosphatase [Acidobacteria bacterium]|nr:trehalose-phosphatase [Acidobacteriota bacterium]
MRYLLSPSCRPVLETLARSRTLCAFDFDGTLAPITAHPDQGELTTRTQRLLARLADCYPCIVLSGRARHDLLGKLNGLPIQRAIGSHGADAGHDSPGLAALVRDWKAALEAGMNPIAGVWIEDKGSSLAIHYRQSVRRPHSRRHILKATRGLSQARVFGGKCVVNVVAEDAPHKGMALARERDRMAAEWVLYAGDDTNDEDAFALGGNLVAVRIGRSSRSHARYYLKNQSEIDTLLESLDTLRGCPAPPLLS